MAKRENVSKTEQDSAEPDVVFHVTGDTPEPRQAPWGFIIRNPLVRTLMPREQIRVNLNVTANVPMLVFPSRNVSEAVTVVGLTGGVLLPGQNLVVQIENHSTSVPLLVEDLEPLVNLHPLRFSGTFAVD